MMGWSILKSNYKYDIHTICDIFMKQDSRSPEQNRSLYPTPVPTPSPHPPPPTRYRVQSLYS